MQNPNVKYLKTPQGDIAVFSLEHNRLWCRRQTSDGRYTPFCIAEGVSAFSLCQYESYTYLLYPTTDGRLILSASSDLMQWEPRPLWQASDKRWQNTYCFMAPQKDAFHLFYGVSQPQSGNHVLEYALFQKGQWQPPYQIDHFLPLPGAPFLGRRLGENHVILYYRSHHSTISAREILLSPFTMGSLSPLIQTGGTCTDFSILEDNQQMHILYLSRNLFRNQVVYRCKQGSAVGRPFVLWESGSACDHCLVYRQQDKIVLFWCANGLPMRCICENGTSIGPVERCTFPFPLQSLKGEFIGASDPFAAEAIGDRQNNFHPAIFSENTPSLSQPQLYAASTPAPSPVREEENNELEELRALLSQRSEEISAVNAKWKAQVDALQEKLAAYENAESTENNTP